MHPIPLLRPVAVDRVMSDALDFAAMHAQIGQIARGQVLQFTQGATIHAVFREPLHRSIDCSAQVFAEDVQSRAGHVDRGWHRSCPCGYIRFGQ